MVAETLEALGAQVAFGVPGVHALAIWNALRSSEVKGIVMRTELAAGFAAQDKLVQGLSLGAVK